MLTGKPTSTESTISSGIYINILQTYPLFLLYKTCRLAGLEPPFLLFPIGQVSNLRSRSPTDQAAKVRFTKGRAIKKKMNLYQKQKNLSQRALAALRFVNLEVQISWQAQHFVNLEVQISWQAQHFVNLEVQISWQAKHFEHLQ